ncbi:MAG: hypothetical protein IPK31_21565 [Chitinophagaceae bacterium]|nr:hypothetical protein [Chitinophagaceae bacterium]
MNKIQTIRQFLYKNGFLLLLAGWALTFSYLFQYYWSYSSAPAQVKSALQGSVNKREKDFNTILKDTLLLQRLSSNKYSKASFQKLLNKDYFILLPMKMQKVFKPYSGIHKPFYPAMNYGSGPMVFGLNS